MRLSDDKNLRYWVKFLRCISFYGHWNGFTANCCCFIKQKWFLGMENSFIHPMWWIRKTKRTWKFEYLLTCALFGSGLTTEKLSWNLISTQKSWVLSLKNIIKVKRLHKFFFIWIIMETLWACSTEKIEQILKINGENIMIRLYFFHVLINDTFSILENRHIFHKREMNRMKQEWRETQARESK